MNSKIQLIYNVNFGFYNTAAIKKTSRSNCAFRDKYHVSMSLFCLSHCFVYLLYFCPSQEKARTEV